jgi:hypothetical protein
MVAIPGLTPDGDPSADISSKALNVTRVGGLGSLIAAVAAASGKVFADAKSTDPVALRVAIPAIRGAIIVAALISVSIMISADIKARGLAAQINKSGDTKAPSAKSASDGREADPGKKAVDDRKTYISAARSSLQDLGVHDAADPAGYRAFSARLKSLTPPLGFAWEHELLIAKSSALGDDAAKAHSAGPDMPNIGKLLSKHLAEFNCEGVKALSALEQ